MRRLIGVGVVAAAFGSAQAGTMFFYGVDALSEPVTISGLYNVGGNPAGFLDFNESPTLGDIRSVCVDLAHGNEPGHSWTDTLWDSSTYGDLGIQYAGNIVAADFASVTTADQAAGLQIAVWEARYDNISNPLPDFTTGNVIVTGITPGALAAANLYWQDRLTSGNAIYIRSEDGGQDQMTPVPEPVSLGVLATGVAMLVRRRRQAR